MVYSENAKIINMRLTISVTDMKAYIRQNCFNTSQTNRSGLFSRELDFKGGVFGLAVVLLRVYPKIGVGVYRTP